MPGRIAVRRLRCYDASAPWAAVSPSMPTLAGGRLSTRCSGVADRHAMVSRATMECSPSASSSSAAPGVASAAFVGAAAPPLLRRYGLAVAPVTLPRIWVHGGMRSAGGTPRATARQLSQAGRGAHQTRLIMLRHTGNMPRHPQHSQNSTHSPQDSWASTQAAHDALERLTKLYRSVELSYRALGIGAAVLILGSGCGLWFFWYNWGTVKNEISAGTAGVVSDTIRDKQLQYDARNFSKELLNQLLTDEEVAKTVAQWTMRLLVSLQNEIGALFVRILAQEQVVDAVNRLADRLVAYLCASRTIQERVGQLLVDAICLEASRNAAAKWAYELVMREDVTLGFRDLVVAALQTDAVIGESKRLGIEIVHSVLADQGTQDEARRVLNETLRDGEVRSAAKESLWTIVMPWSSTSKAAPARSSEAAAQAPPPAAAPATGTSQATAATPATEATAEDDEQKAIRSLDELMVLPRLTEEDRQLLRALQARMRTAGSDDVGPPAASAFVSGPSTPSTTTSTAPSATAPASAPPVAPAAATAAAPAATSAASPDAALAVDPAVVAAVAPDTACAEPAARTPSEASTETPTTDDAAAPAVAPAATPAAAHEAPAVASAAPSNAERDVPEPSVEPAASRTVEPPPREGLSEKVQTRTEQVSPESATEGVQEADRSSAALTPSAPSQSPVTEQSESTGPEVQQPPVEKLQEAQALGQHLKTE